MTNEELKKNLLDCRFTLEEIIVKGPTQGGLLKGLANVLDDCINNVKAEYGNEIKQ